MKGSPFRSGISAPSRVHCRAPSRQRGRAGLVDRGLQLQIRWDCLAWSPNISPSPSSVNQMGVREPAMLCRDRLGEGAGPPEHVLGLLPSRAHIFQRAVPKSSLQGIHTDPGRRFPACTAHPRPRHSLCFPSGSVHSCPSQGKRSHSHHLHRAISQR